MFTQYYKTAYRFGDIESGKYRLSDNILSQHDHSDVVYPTGSSTPKYYNKKVPFWPASSNRLNIFQTSVSATNDGWSARDDVYVDESPFTANYIPLTYNSIHFNGNDIVMTVTASNTTSDPISIKSMIFTAYMPVYSAVSGSSNSSVYLPIMFHNLATPIEIPANDSVLIDITFSAGDVSDVTTSS